MRKMDRDVEPTTRTSGLSKSFGRLSGPLRACKEVLAEDELGETWTEFNVQTEQRDTTRRETDMTGDMRH